MNEAADNNATLNPSADRPTVCVAMPGYDGRGSDGAFYGLLVHPSRGQRLNPVAIRLHQSLLANNFNTLWVMALNHHKQERCQYFAMLHDDIGPSPFWLDVLYEEMKRHDADVISAVSPIKDRLGLTSTAVCSGDRWNSRRLTLKEVFDLPETFGTQDLINAGIAGPGQQLLVNTGCMLVDLSKPWVHKLDANDELACHFTIDDRIRYDREADEYAVETVPEDWNFSRMVLDHGGRLAATRKVVIQHEGRMTYSSEKPWGLWDTDQKFAAPPEAVTAE